MNNILKIFMLLVGLNISLFGNMEAILKINTGGHTSLITDVIVTKDKSIITSSQDATVSIWDKDGKRKRRILGQIGNDFGSINSIALSKDEKYLAVGGFLDKDSSSSNIGLIRIYNYSTGKLFKILKNKTGIVLDISFSPDNKYMVSSYNHGEINLWDVHKDFKLIKKIKEYVVSLPAVKILKTNSSYKIISIGINRVLSIYDIKKDKTIKQVSILSDLLALDTSTNDIAVCGKNKNIYSINPKTGKTELLKISTYGKIFIYDYDLKHKKSITLETECASLKYSNDSGFLISGPASRPLNVNIYDVNKNYKIKATYPVSDVVRAVDFLNTSTAISAGGAVNEITLWDIKEKRTKKVIKGAYNRFSTVGVSRKSIAWGERNATGTSFSNNLVQLEKQMNLSTLEISSIRGVNFKKGGNQYKNYTLSLAKNSKGNDDSSVLNIYKDNKMITSIVKNSTNGFRHHCFIWYKEYIISGGDNGLISIYNTKGNWIASLRGHSDMITSLSVRKNKLVSSSFNEISIWNLGNLKPNNKPQKYNEKEIKAAMKILEKQGLYFSRDQVIEYAKKVNFNLYISNPQNIKPILSLFITKDNEYVAWTPDGFFDASKNGAQYIGYHINQGPYKEAEFIAVDALYSTFYRPDLIQKALAGESLEKYAKNINIDKLLQDGLAPEVHILTKTKKTKEQDLDLKVQVCPKATGGYDNLTLLINDMPVSVIDTSRALKLKKKSKRDDCFIYDQTISLAGGINNIGFRATNKAGNIESKPDFLEVTFDDTNLKKRLRSKLAKMSGEQNINDLHILAIAVNEYADEDLRLNYSINDASKMLSTIEDVAKPLFNKIHTYKLFDKDVTKQQIKNVFNKVNSTREDVFLLYIAGHGITDEYNGNYYYIPYDFINKEDEKAVQSQGVGQTDLMLGLSKVTALKSLVLLDTCNSGSFVEADMQKTTTNRLARATGRATISASSKSQVALEGYKGHGVFTYTLLEALKGKGYKDDKKITINELNDYVEDTLPDRTYKKWGYRQIPQSSMYGTDFNIGAK